MYFLLCIILIFKYDLDKVEASRRSDNNPAFSCMERISSLKFTIRYFYTSERIYFLDTIFISKAYSRLAD